MECYCTKCGRYYFKYTGRPIEPKEGTPTDKQIERATQREQELSVEMNRLRAEGFIGDEFTLRRQAHKNFAYAVRSEVPTLVTEDDKVLFGGKDEASRTSYDTRNHGRRLRWIRKILINKLLTATLIRSTTLRN